MLLCFHRHILIFTAQAVPNAFSRDTMPANNTIYSRFFLRFSASVDIHICRWSRSLPAVLPERLFHCLLAYACAQRRNARQRSLLASISDERPPGCHRS